MQLKSTCGRRAVLSRFTIKCGKHHAPNRFNCLIGQSRASIILKRVGNAVMKIKDSNCVGILFDQGEAATASDLSEYTIKMLPRADTKSHF